MENWKALWSTLITLCCKRKMMWLLPVIYHVPSVITWPTTDKICSVGNNTSPSDLTHERSNGLSIDDLYSITLQIIIYIIFGCHIGILIIAYGRDFADKHLVHKLSNIYLPEIKSVEIWRIVRCEKPFSCILVSKERILLVLEFFYLVLLTLRFSFLATCGLLYGNVKPQWTVSMFENILVKEKPLMPNALFAYSNCYLLIGLFMAILISALLESILVLILFLTPKFRSRILESLCVGVDGKLAARFVASKLDSDRLWTLCAVGYKSPKHFTHAVEFIRKELATIKQGC